MEHKSNTFESFEQALEVLKETVNNLETGNNIQLDELVQNYEKGINAYNYCIEKLEKTKSQISMVENDNEK